MKINRLFAFAAILGAISFTSCKDDDSLPSGISLDPSSVQIYVGQTATLTPKFTPSGSTATPTWTSSNESVATVKGGYVSGIAAGTATITATLEGGISSTCSVTVSNVAASSLTLNETDVTLYENEGGIQLVATVEPYNVTFPEVSWKSSAPSVATVDDNGNVAPVSIGEAVITASLADGTKASCNVKVTLRVPTEPETLSFWKSDEAGYRGLFGAASDNGKSAGDGGWLTYSDGIARWKANTTGKPRRATLTLSTGSAITIQQVDAKDIAGDYILYSNAFKGLSNTKQLGARRHATTLKIEVADGADLNGRPHNLDIVGMYLEAKCPASLVVTDDGVKVYTYLSLDFQTVTGAEVAIIPEMTNSATYGTGYFAPQTFGPEGCNYCWIGWDLTDAFSAPKITMGSGEDRQIVPGRYFCGFSVVKKGYAEGSYTTIYQLNYNNMWTWSVSGGAFFEKQ